MTGPQATALAAVCSLISAAIVAWITGAFEQSTAVNQAEIDKIKAQVVEQIKQEGTARVEEIKQLTAKIVEESKAKGSVTIEQFKLQRDLILKAIETLDRDEAQKRLKFFAETGLIPDFADKVIAFTKEKGINEIPTISGKEPDKLTPLRGRHQSLIGAVVLVNHGDDPLCAGLALSSNKVLIMKHCVPENISKYTIRYAMETNKTRSASIDSAETIDAKGAQKFSQDMVVVHVKDATLTYIRDVAIRPPNLGESVFIIGYAPSRLIAYRALKITPAFDSFVSEGCAVKEVDQEQGFLSTDCLSSSGTSGSPIFASSDGALLSVVSWGRNWRETNGPILSQFKQQLQTDGR